MATYFGGPPPASPTFSNYPMTCTPTSGKPTKVDTISVTRDLGYTCVIAGFGPTQNLDSELTIGVTPASVVTAGESFDAIVDYTVDMGTALTGPVSKIEGTMDFDFAFGGQTTTVSVPANNWTAPPGGTSSSPARPRPPWSHRRRSAATTSR